MAEPYNYNVASPMAGFAQGLNVGNLLDEQRKAREVERRTREGEAALLAAFEGGTPTTEQINNLVLKNPAIADRAKQAYAMRTAPQREADERQRTELYMLMRSGDTEAVKARMRTFADAARNSGQERQAAQAEANLRVYEQNPNAGMISIGAAIAATNFELWKKLTETDTFTSFQKDLIAAGIDPKSAEGIKQSKLFVQNRTDPIVTMETPKGGQFIGPMSEFQKRYGIAPAGAVPLKTVSNAAQYEALPPGSQFLDPQGNIRTKR
jgi:hypothetical protein